MTHVDKATVSRRPGCSNLSHKRVCVRGFTGFAFTGNLARPEKRRCCLSTETCPRPLFFESTTSFIMDGQSHDERAHVSRSCCGANTTASIPFVRCFGTSRPRSPRKHQEGEGHEWVAILHSVQCLLLWFSQSHAALVCRLHLQRSAAPCHGLRNHRQRIFRPDTHPIHMGGNEIIPCFSFVYGFKMYKISRFKNQDL